MSITYNSKIIRDGIRLHIDAANPKSYIGTGEVWKDVSGGNETCFLNEGTTFSPDDKGSMFFDGANDFVNCGQATYLGPSLTGLTVSAWIKIQTRKTAIIAENGTSFSANTFYMAQENATTLSFLVCSNTNTIQRADIASYQTGVWFNFVGIWQSGRTVATYINGIFTRTSVNNPVGDLITLRSGNTNLWLGRIPNGALAFNGNISDFKIYDRALTGDELVQNFNAYRGRYGI